MNHLILYGNYAFCADRADADMRAYKLNGGEHSQSEMDAFRRALAREVPVPPAAPKVVPLRRFAA